MKCRDFSLDIIRVLACFMVVAMHSPIPSAGADGRFLVPLSYITAPCIGLFFMVSGALLLPVGMGFFPFLKKRLLKVVLPTVLWSMIYLFAKLYFGESEINVYQALVSVPFSSSVSGVLWFMYTLAGLYLLAPVLSPWLERATKHELQFVLVLWAVSLCYPLLEGFVVINRTDTGLLYYFTGYAGYFLLGFYLKKYPDSLSMFPVAMIAASGAVLLVALEYYGVEFDFYRLFWYESIFIVALCILIWKAVVRLKVSDSANWWKRLIVKLSGLSFGVYLVHILIMRGWLWHCGLITGISVYPLQCLVVALATFVLSVLFSLALSCLPFSQWIIGYGRKCRS